MGFLTTCTIYNDGLDLLKKHPDEFCSKLYDASLSMEQKEFGIGNFCNFANVQRTRHADDSVIYIHAGNTVTEIAPWSKEFEHMIKTNPDMTNMYIRLLENTLSEIKKHAAYVSPAKQDQ
jgi:hypothetical protein